MAEGNGLARPETTELAGFRSKITPTGLDIPEDLTYEEWEHEFKLVYWLHHWSPWALGDLLAFGERRWGKTYAQAVPITGRAIKTLYNKAYASRQFPPEMRSEVLSVTHHEVLVGMTPEKKRHYLAEGERLEKESNGHLSVQHFREYVADQERVPAELGTTVEVVQPPATCNECFGSGKCPTCAGSGEVPANRKKEES